MIYRLTKRRSAQVRAVRFDGTNFAEVQELTGEANFIRVEWNRTKRLQRGVVAEVLNTQYGEWVSVRAGQWIVQGVVGEFYPIDIDVLHGGYEEPEGGWPA